MNAHLFVWLWAVVAIVVLAMALYRNLAGIHGNEEFHVLGPQVKREGRTMGKLLAIDRWGQLLTVAVLAYGLVLAFAYLWAKGAEARIH